MNPDSREMHRLIEDSRNKFRTLVDGFDDEIFSIDTDFIMTSVNKALARSLNTHPKEVVGRHCYEALYGLDAPCQNGNFVCPVLFALKSGHLETALQTIEEEGVPTKYLELRAMPVQDDQGGVDQVILARRDITTQKTAEQQIRDYSERLAQDVRERTLELQEANLKLTEQRNELESANQELIQLEQIKRDLTNMVIHDLKGPLAEIVANLEMLKYETLTEIQSDLLESAAFGSDEISRMITNLLDISRMEENKLPLDLAPLETQLKMVEIAKRYRPLAKLKDIAIITEASEELPPIKTDSLLFERVLINLVTNAIDHTFESGQIILMADEAENELLFEIKDNGRGIPQEILEKIFEKFSQGREGKPKTGSGLGLTFTKMAIESLGGQISVRSEVGLGTSFIFTLPKTVSSEEDL